MRGGAVLYAASRERIVSGHMFRNRAIAAVCLGLALTRSIAEDPSSPLSVGTTSPAAAVAPPAAAAEPESLAASLLPLEIATSTYYELVALAKRLGLPQTGDAEELRSRLYAHYGIAAPSVGEKKRAGRTVTIERAAAASYGAVDESGDIVRASGGVVLALAEENGDTHRIEASEIIYDRARNAVTARGGVSYTRTAEGATEIFTGESLNANLDDWSGVFLDGKIRKASAAAGAAAATGATAAKSSAATAASTAAASERGLVLSAETMLKRSADVMVFENGVITSCDEEDPHFAVRAGKVWLLGVREWAIQDALFSLGNVPVLWLPFFYYPGDELVFNPVFGYRSREGRYVQTTTYLMGRKPRSTTTTSILKIADDGKDGPTELKGLFLRRVSGNAPEAAGSTQKAAGSTLKAMVDAYSSLGGAASLLGSFPKAGPLSSLNFFAGLGISRTVFLDSSGSYSPFAASGDWKSDWNGTSVLGLEIPLRYSLEFSSSFKLGPLSGSLSLPFASDPYFDRDFRNRSEDMDWVKAISTSVDTSTAPSARTSLVQRADLSMSLQPKALAPYVGSIDLQRIGASMTWASKVRSPVTSAYDPSYTFLHPSSFKPLDAAISLRGVAFKYPFTAVSPAKAAKAAEGDGAGGAQEAAAPPAEPLPEPVGPWEAAAEDAAATAGEASKGQGAPAAAATDAGTLDFGPPARAANAPSTTPAASAASGGFTATVDWNLAPTGFFEDRYKSDAWSEPSDVDLKLLYRLANYRLSGGLDAKAAYGGDLVSGSIGLAFIDQDQTRLAQDDPTSATAKLNAATDAAYKARSLKSAAKLSSRPFARNSVLASTSFAWNMDSTLYGYKYDTANSSVGNPVYAETFLKWDAASITAHNAAVTVSAKPAGLTQSLVLTASLPPLTESYTAKFALDAGLADLGLQSRAYRPSGGAFSFDPLTATLVVGASPGPVLNDSLVLDLTKGLPVSNVASFVWGPFSSSITAKRAKSYIPELGKGWKEYGDERFTPTDLNLSLKSDVKSAAGEAMTWSLSPSLSLTQNLLRFSESNMTLSLSASVKAPGAGTITLSAQSQNSAAWQYYSGFFPVLNEFPRIGGYWKNPIVDIAQSLAIWHPASLRDTNWKLKNLSLKATHELHDWDLTVELGAKPILKDKNYILNSTFSILLAWRDISEIKSQIKYNSEGIAGKDATLTY